jgi:hypothetical protein
VLVVGDKTNGRFDSNPLIIQLIPAEKAVDAATLCGSNPEYCNKLGLTAKINAHEKKCKIPQLISLDTVVFLSFILNNLSMYIINNFELASSAESSLEVNRSHQFIIIFFMKTLL